MKRTALLLSLAALAVTPLMASGKNTVSGAYVEARTAEVFTGGCVMGSEAETMGKQAVLAWKVDHGTVNGVPIDGLSVVAAVAGDRNLGIYELGGARATSKSALFVDERANPAQRLALVAMAREASSVVGTIVSVTPAPIEFSDKGGEISVAAPQVALAVNKHLQHDPTCGAQQWFHPLASVDNAVIGTTNQHSFSGTGLGSKWSDPNKPSAFFGTFSY